MTISPPPPSPSSSSSSSFPRGSSRLDAPLPPPPLSTRGNAPRRAARPADPDPPGVICRPPRARLPPTAPPPSVAFLALGDASPLGPLSAVVGWAPRRAPASAPPSPSSSLSTNLRLLDLSVLLPSFGSTRDVLTRDGPLKGSFPSIER